MYVIHVHDTQIINTIGISEVNFLGEMTLQLMHPLSVIGGGDDDRRTCCHSISGAPKCNIAPDIFIMMVLKRNNTTNAPRMMQHHCAI